MLQPPCPHVLGRLLLAAVLAACLSAAQPNRGQQDYQWDHPMGVFNPLQADHCSSEGRRIHAVNYALTSSGAHTACLPVCLPTGLPACVPGCLLPAWLPA